MRQWKWLAAALLAAAAFPVAAQESKPLRIVVPFAAGGVADILARQLAQGLHDRYPAGVIVENRTGAGGNIGAEFVFRSPPDGYTLMVASPGPLVINQGLYAKLGYNPAQWAGVATIASVPNALIVGPKRPWSDARAFIEQAKAKPGELSYASQGNGTTSHLSAKLFESLVHTTLIHVPYKGDSPALTALFAGEVDAFFGSVSAALALHQSGRVHILAVADEQRAKVLPDVPTFKELGLPGMQSVTWYGVVAPPGIDAGRLTQLNAAINAVLTGPDFDAALNKVGLSPMVQSTAETAAFMAAQTRLWQGVITEAKVTIE